MPAKTFDDVGQLVDVVFQVRDRELLRLDLGDAGVEVACQTAPRAPVRRRRLRRSSDRLIVECVAGAPVDVRPAISGLSPTREN